MSLLPPAPTVETLKDSVAQGFPAALAQLAALVRIPSISWRHQPETAVTASAETIAEAAEALGVFERVEVAFPDPADVIGQPYPAVLATRPARAGFPTVLLYAHHDVQPVGDREAWSTEPFEPTLKGDRLYGRGAADDKAGVVAHLAALAALKDAVPDPGVGIVLFVEGEEEAGSPNFASFIERHRDEIRADALVIADSGNWDTETPALTATLRGNVVFDVVVTTMDHALHSGQFGGPAPDAATALVRLLGTLWDEDGAVAVPGLVTEPFVYPDYDEARFREESGILPESRLMGRGDILQRMCAAPSITVIGTDLPTMTAASNTLHPSARARVSVRIGPGNDPAAALEAIAAHLTAHAPFGARVEVDQPELAKPFAADLNGPSVRHLRAAMREAWGVDPVNMGMGGSIPFIPLLLEQMPGAEVLVIGVEDPDTRAHSPNESLHVPTLRNTILTEALFLAGLDAEGNVRPGADVA